MDKSGTRWTVSEYGRRSVATFLDGDPSSEPIRVTFLFAENDGRRIYRDGVLGDLERLTDKELLALPEHIEPGTQSSGT